MAALLHVCIAQLEEVCALTEYEDDDEREALQQLGELLLRSTVVLTRIDASGRGSGLVIPWKDSARVITARHVIADGEWAIEVPSLAGQQLRSERDLLDLPIEERRTMKLRLKADQSSLVATTHDIAWAEFDFSREAVAAEESAQSLNVPFYLGPMDTTPDAQELYAFVATNRDESHRTVRVMVREIAAEAFMTFIREERDGYRFFACAQASG